jgi:plastocyanin
MRRVLAFAVCLAACHLAEDPPARDCAAGSHPESGYCAADAVGGPVITIAPADAGGAGCTVSPDTVTVAPNGEFTFKNEDAVDHVITGADGQTWATAKVGQPPSRVGLTRVGRWPYVVSGCASGGTVVVE